MIPLICLKKNEKKIKKIVTLDVLPTNCKTKWGKRKRRRARRSSSDNAILIPVKDEAPYIYDPPQVNITTIPTFPTKSGVTKIQATDKCTGAVTESIFGKACLKMYPDMEIKPIIDECVMDIKVRLLLISFEMQYPRSDVYTLRSKIQDLRSEI